MNIEGILDRENGHTCRLQEPWNPISANHSCKIEVCSFKIPAETAQNTNITTAHSKGPRTTANSLNDSTIEATLVTWNLTGNM
jgi:hypothetical protein